MAKTRVPIEWIARDGLPSHFVLLRLTWNEFLAARHQFREELIRDDSSTVGRIVENRAHARMLSMLFLLETFCDVALENEWPIPPEIDLGVSDPISEIER